MYFKKKQENNRKLKIINPQSCVAINYKNGTIYAGSMMVSRSFARSLVYTRYRRNTLDE